MTHINACLIGVTAASAFVLMGCDGGVATTDSEPPQADSQLSSRANPNKHFYLLHTTAGDDDADDIRGLISVTLVSDPAFTFHADFSLDVGGLTPNTAYIVQRSPEIGRPLAADGICQRALGEYPWEQPNSVGFPAAPAFLTFANNAVTPPPLVTFTSNAWGLGSAKWSNDNNVITHGQAFDVVFRVVDTSAAPVSDMRTDCTTLTNL